MMSFISLFPSKKRSNKILHGVSGILKPGRMTLLLGPPSSGKTTLLLSLAGKLDKKLKESGKITYCGHELSEFVPQRTCAYISQQDLHISQMTVRETLDFSGRCLGVGTRYEMMSELCRREKDAGIKPDPEIDAFMKATAVKGQNTNLVTDYILKVLGLDICADILVGDDMTRGISGGQKKRLTTGEMLAGPAKALFMDEISNGLDSSTTFQIVKFIRQMVHIMDGTVMVSLLQPTPETFELFDDIVLLSEGHVIYHGPRDKALEFFESMGFKCPERKGVADFLQEVTSKKDQHQYWYSEEKPYRYVSVYEFTQSFKSFHVGRNLLEGLRAPNDDFISHPSALEKKKYGISNWEIFKACFSREWLLMKRNSFLYVFKVVQITILSILAMTVYLRVDMRHETVSDGGKYFGALFFGMVNATFNGMAELSMTISRLPIFYKQREFFFYSPWAFALSYSFLKIPLSALESGIWTVLTYYVIGFAPAASRFFRQFLAFFFVHQMALSLFRFIAAVARTMVIANTFGTFAMLIVYVLGGFVTSKDDIQQWWIWGYWTSPMMYGQNAISINEFLDPRWGSANNDSRIDASTIGKAVLRTRGMFVSESWYWISLGALVGFSFIFNACFILALTYLNPIGSSRTILIVDKDLESERSSPSRIEGKSDTKITGPPEGIEVPHTYKSSSNGFYATSNHQAKKGMILPFQPLSLVFSHVNYYVDMPAEMRRHGIKEDRLQLLCDVSGAIRPGVLTALVGVTGAGKTTLMDVLAGRKSGGYIEGHISISGFPKKQETFARVTGYCEQNDIHSPHITVYESLAFSAWLRLAPDISKRTRKEFIDEIMELVELNVLRDAMVGVPGIDGLSIEQRKRLTIAVELVSNPSIIFMDEPTSGLDARAAAIVMRTIRNTVDTGRTIVCTIHQPSIEIFEAFDELLLMKRGGRIIYAGPLGHHSSDLIQYFEAIPGVQKISERLNPATWMLEITSHAVEAKLNLDFANIYFQSSLYRKNQDLINELSSPAPGSNDLSFHTKYAQSFTMQCMACFHKQFWSYWKNPEYNAIRFFFTIVIGLIFGSIFWKKFKNIESTQELFNIIGAIYAAVFFLGAANCGTCQPVVDLEKTVFYREKAAGMYSALSYACSQVMIEIVYIIPQSLVYTLLLYSMIGFSWSSTNFFWFFYFVFMCLTYFTLCGLMLVALVPNFHLASIIPGFIYPLWNLFSGFVIFKSQMPIWWRWFVWVNPLFWTIQGIIVSQFGENASYIDDSEKERTITIKAYLGEELDYHHDYLPYNALIHLGFALLFAFVFCCSIKYLNFQRR